MILPAEKHHAPLIQSIAEKSWAVAYSQILSAEQLEYMLDLFYTLPVLEKTMEEQTFLLHGTEGFAAYQLNYPAVGVCKIHKLYVLPETQGSGAGRKMVEAIAEVALEQGCHQLILNVNKYNRALGFYQKIGFKIKKEEVIDIGRGFVMDDYVLIKNLTPPSKRVG